MSDLIENLLNYVNEHDGVNTLDLVSAFGVDHQKIVGALKSIEATGNVLSTKSVTTTVWELTEEGKMIAENGSHEANLYKSISNEGVKQPDLMKIPNSKIGFSKAMSLGWILIDKSGGVPIVKKRVDSITDVTQQHLQSILSGNFDDSSVPHNMKIEYKKRKLMQEIQIKSFLLSKGEEFRTSICKNEADLTVEMLVGDLWKNLNFKPYNFNALGYSPDSGHLHPLLKVRSEFRQIFLEMGFSEMPTNNYVESSFWNFDSLFQPQQHPARDAHDTFFISDPALCENFPNSYLEKVKQVHSKGGYGSQVFRNETLDATHLAEFHQVEGVVADRGLALGDLIGVLYEFFSKLGITQLEFKPAYNPYTEPSMEIFCYHPGLGKWIEVGNSGIFRPEMLLPMGLPEDVNVIAWGLSLERPTMIKYGINNIRDLVGPKVDLQMVKDGSICRLGN
uniref:phenylalanine--tRNA ligase n=1 Tax=Xenopsylla cheopis TaxID=163159 RepID=A0A6M2DTV0_XENCH